MNTISNLSLNVVNFVAAAIAALPDPSSIVALHDAKLETETFLATLPEFQGCTEEEIFAAADWCVSRVVEFFAGGAEGRLWRMVENGHLPDTSIRYELFCDGTFIAEGGYTAIFGIILRLAHDGDFWRFLRHHTTTSAGSA